MYLLYTQISRIVNPLKLLKLFHQTIAKMKIKRVIFTGFFHSIIQINYFRFVLISIKIMFIFKIVIKRLFEPKKAKDKRFNCFVEITTNDKENEQFKFRLRNLKMNEEIMMGIIYRAVDINPKLSLFKNKNVETPLKQKQQK